LYNVFIMRTKEVGVSLCAALLLISLPCFSQSAPGRQQQIESHNRQAGEYLKENKPDQAATEFRAILALDPNNVDAHGNLGALLFFQGAYADAIPQLRAALKLRPTLWKIQALLGIAEKRTGDIDKARTDLETAFPKVPEEKVRIETGMELIEIYSATGDLDKAAATISVLRGLEPTDEAILYSAYRIYSDLTDEAMLSLSIVAPNSARMHQMMAHELAKQGHTAEAIANYRAALKIDPQLPGLHFELAEMLNSPSVPDGQEEAESEYKAALEVNPLDEQAESRLGDIAARRNDLNEAYERYTRAVQLRPDDAEANLGLAKVLMSMNQPQKAQPLLERAVQLDPTNAVAHFRLSTLYRQDGRTADAENELAQYQKYKEMKEKLRSLYQEMRLQPAREDDDTDPRQ
ncbi:MAG: tetratricopeptide repeat protein, partial [Candidatus Acidiferrales bacterium]